MSDNQPARRRRASPEQALLAAGALLILIHTVDDIISADEFDMAPAVISAVAVATAALYPVIPLWGVVALALFVGVTRLIGGVLHVVSLVDGGGTEPGDYTGVLEGLGALLFLAVAVRAVRHRSSKAHSHR